MKATNQFKKHIEMPMTMPVVGKKFLAQLGGMANESAASEVSSFAKKQMLKMGWTEGKGLGKQEQGMATHIKVRRREKNVGVGIEAKMKEEVSNQWWYNVYDKVAQSIVIHASDDDKPKKKKKSKKRSQQHTEINEPSDEQLFAATGGKLFGRRAYGSCKGKLRRDQLQTQGRLDDEGPVKKKSKKAKRAKQSQENFE